MTDITDTLAQALRNVTSLEGDMRDHVIRSWEALAAYDARQPIPDPLTVAYIARGATTAYINTAPEYIAECIQHAAMLDSLAHLIEPTGANFYYEFAEPFGGIYGIQLLAGENPDAQAIASAIIKELQDAN